MYHTTLEPSALFRHRMSTCVSLSKSPVPTICQLWSATGSSSALASQSVPFINQTTFEPVDAMFRQ